MQIARIQESHSHVFLILGKTFTWKTSKWNFVDISLMQVRAKGVKFCWTTKIALKTFSDFMRLV